MAAAAPVRPTQASARCKEQSEPESDYHNLESEASLSDSEDAAGQPPTADLIRVLLSEREPRQLESPC